MKLSCLLHVARYPRLSSKDGQEIGPFKNNKATLLFGKDRSASLSGYDEGALAVFRKGQEVDPIATVNDACWSDRLQRLVVQSEQGCLVVPEGRRRLARLDLDYPDRGARGGLEGVHAVNACWTMAMGECCFGLSVMTMDESA